MWRAMTVSLFALAACSQVPYKITGDKIKAPLTQIAGDIKRGQILFETREQGHCVLCHAVTSSNATFQGNLGPSLDNIGERLSRSQLRLRIVDYDAYRPGTTMPSYFRRHNLKQVAKNYEGKTILSAQDVEDIVAYLQSLKSAP